MDMRMMGERRTPSMENRGDADAGAEMPGVGGDGDQGLGRYLKQDIVDCRLVLIRDIADRRRQREDQVIVWHRQQIGLASRQPFLRHSPLALRAVPVAAAVVRYPGVCALLAARDMSAESCGAAALDRRHHLELAEAHMAGIGPAPCRAVAAKDIRDLQRWTRHDKLASGGRFGALPELARNAIERAYDLPDGLGGDTRIERGGVELGMSQQDLDHPDIGVLLQ